MKKKAIKNIITTIMAVITMISVGTTSVMASGIDNVKAGEKFLNSNGKLEQVVRKNADGSFVTEELSGKNIERQKKRCSHPAASLEAIADLPQDTKTVGKSYCCFKYRSVTKCRCKKCGYTVKTYGAWHSHSKHRYPFLGKECKACGYKK